MRPRRWGLPSVMSIRLADSRKERTLTSCCSASPSSPIATAMAKLMFRRVRHAGHDLNTEAITMIKTNQWARSTKPCILS